MLFLGDVFQHFVVREHEFRLASSGYPRRTQRIVASWRMSLVEFPGEKLLPGIRVDDRDPANCVVRLDDVDHAPGTEVREREPRRGGEGGLELERVRQRAAGLR